MLFILWPCRKDWAMVSRNAEGVHVDIEPPNMCVLCGVSLTHGYQVEKGWPVLPCPISVDYHALVDPVAQQTRVTEGLVHTECLQKFISERIGARVTIECTDSVPYRSSGVSQTPGGNASVAMHNRVRTVAFIVAPPLLSFAVISGMTFLLAKCSV